MATMDAGAEDIKTDDGTIEVYCDPVDFGKVRDAVTEAGIPFTNAEITMLPKNTIKVEDSKEASQILRLMDLLDDNDDVQQAYANFDIPDEILEEVAG
jgi:transcriptional/translational regulatory protein YebC/TACO1